MVSGHDRKGMGLSLISTRIVADLIAKGHSSVPIEAFDPGRFGPTEQGNHNVSGCAAHGGWWMASRR